MNLSKKVFKNQELNEKNFSNTDFVDQDFLECILKWSNFENSKFTNVNFLKCDIGESNFKNTCFINCSFDSIKAFNMNFSNSFFKDCNFLEFDMRDSDMNEIKIEKSILKNLY